MNQPAVVELMKLSLTAFGFWGLAFWLYRDYRIDSTRQKLFTVRGELFDYALDAGLAFDHPAYALLRLRMNRLIRFGHRFTSVGLVAFWASRSFIGGEPIDELSDDWEAAVATVESSEVRDRLREFSARATHIMVQRLVYGSWVLLVGLAIFAIGLALKGAATNALDRFSQTILGGTFLEAELAKARGGARLAL